MAQAAKKGDSYEAVHHIDESGSFVTPHEELRYFLLSDKLETSVEFEGKSSKLKWKYVMKDKSLKACCPEGTQLPRTHVADFLKEALLSRVNPSTASASHTLFVHKTKNDMKIDLHLSLSSAFNPKFSFAMTQMDVTTEDILKSQMQDLKEESEQLKTQLADVQAETKSLTELTASLKEDNKKRDATIESQNRHIEELMRQVKILQDLSTPGPQTQPNINLGGFTFGQGFQSHTSK